MDNKHTISVLNDLIETSKDGEKGFSECAEDLRNPQTQAILQQCARDCAAAAAELQQLVRSLGGDPETDTSMAGDMHRRWVDLKSMITGKDDKAILNECEHGEDVAKKSYRKALEHEDLPMNVRSVIEKQYQGVQRNHDQVKALRDAERAKG